MHRIKTPAHQPDLHTSKTRAPGASRFGAVRIDDWALSTGRHFTVTFNPGNLQINRPPPILTAYSQTVLRSFQWVDTTNLLKDAEDLTTHGLHQRMNPMKSSFD